MRFSVCELALLLAVVLSRGVLHQVAELGEAKQLDCACCFTEKSFSGSKSQSAMNEVSNMKNVLHLHQERVNPSTNETPLANGKQQKKSSDFRDPDYRLETPGWPEVETGIYIADEHSKNAGAVYFDVRRIGEKGKRYKTLRLDQDFLGSLVAHAILAEKLSVAPSITPAERKQYAEIAEGVASVVFNQALPEKTTKQLTGGQALSMLAGTV